MFLKQSVLKRLFKSAYKGAGLTVGHYMSEDEETEGYYVAGSYWVTWFDAEFFTKETKAAIIELCGDLPAPGEVFKAMKEGGNQYEIEQRDFYFLPAKYKEAKTHFRVSNTVIEDGGVYNRLLQAQDETKHVIGINEVFVDIIDLKAIDYDGGEWEPEGPVAKCATDPFILWGNNACYLMACRRILDDPEMVEYLEHLERVDII